MEKLETIHLEYVDKTMIPTYGGQTINVTYVLTHTRYGIKNQYNVTAEVRGLQDGSPYLNVVSVERKDNNEETLIDSAVEELFESKLT